MSDITMSVPPDTTHRAGRNITATVFLQKCVIKSRHGEASDKSKFETVYKLTSLHSSKVPKSCND